jgi:hypothetical protein
MNSNRESCVQDTAKKDWERRDKSELLSARISNVSSYQISSVLAISLGTHVRNFFVSSFVSDKRDLNNFLRDGSSTQQYYESVVIMDFLTKKASLSTLLLGSTN